MSIGFAWEEGYFHTDNWNDPTCSILRDWLDGYQGKGKVKELPITDPRKDEEGHIYDPEEIRFRVSCWGHDEYSDRKGEFIKEFEFTVAYGWYQDQHYVFVLRKGGPCYFVSWYKSRGRTDQIAQVEFKDQDVFLMEEPVTIKETTKLIGWFINSDLSDEEPWFPLESLSLRKLNQLNPHSPFNGV